MVRVLTSHQCGLNLIPCGVHLGVEYVVGLGLALRVFLRVPPFLPPLRPPFPSANSTRLELLHKNQLRLYLWLRL